MAGWKFKETLLEINENTMTPVESLMRLNELKRLAEEAGTRLRKVLPSPHQYFFHPHPLPPYSLGVLFQFNANGINYPNFHAMCKDLTNSPNLTLYPIETSFKITKTQFRHFRPPSQPLRKQICQFRTPF